MTCPCGREKSYAECCGALHAGKRQAATAEELMRSRYSAFAKGQIDYLVETQHPSRPVDRKALARSAREAPWTGLTILDTEGGSLIDTTGVVEFEARWVGGSMRERSRFTRLDGRWVYVDGDQR
jgi:SEC-C motif-containing protein